MSGYVLCTQPDPACMASTPASLTASTGVTVCGWSSWMNTDSPMTDGGDFESLAALKPLFNLCSNPITVHCRDANTMLPAPSGVTCDTHTGLSCFNVDHGGQCADYELQVFCACECKILFLFHNHQNSGERRD